MLSIGTVRYGAPRFMLHVCNEGWTGLANCLRDGVGMERKRTEAWRIVDRTDGGRGRDKGQGRGLLVLVVKMFFCVMIGTATYTSTIRYIIQLYACPTSLPTKANYFTYESLTQREHRESRRLSYGKGLNKTPDPRLRANPRRRSHLAGVSFRPFAPPPPNIRLRSVSIHK
ncbi:hypothetical protein CI102_12514 [Trichoderma harzianum]|nr:hypothetical protein CI102_12514 [Trichoderma harzianum]